jgi:hypothetical protein
MTFDLCDDCGSSLLPALFFFSVIVWSGPMVLGALRRHASSDSEQEAMLARLERLALVCAILLTAWAIFR